MPTTAKAGLIKGNHYHDDAKLTGFHDRTGRQQPVTFSI